MYPAPEDKEIDKRRTHRGNGKTSKDNQLIVKVPIYEHLIALHRSSSEHSSSTSNDKTEVPTPFKLRCKFSNHDYKGRLINKIVGKYSPS